MILDGSCEVLLEKNGQVIKKLATISKGDFFGEMSLLTGETRSATVKALEFAQVIRVDKRLFSEILASNPDIPEQLGTIMAQRQLDISAETSKSDGQAVAKLKLIYKIKSFFGI